MIIAEAVEREEVLLLKGKHYMCTFVAERQRECDCGRAKCAMVQIQNARVDEMGIETDQQDPKSL